MVFRDTYEQAWDAGYRNLTPANRYNVDYSMLGTARVEPLIRRIRNAMTDAEMQVENSKGECNFGQHEINFRYGPALRAADEHVIYKNGAKEIAAQEGMAITYMAKYDEREGNSCHIHLSLREEDGTALFGARRPDAARALHRRPARDAPRADPAARAERQLLQALRRRLVRPDRGRVGPRQPHVRAARRRPRRRAARVECRLPGADVNPYLALAALIAGGLHGIDRELRSSAPFEGNAYLSDKPHVPTTLREARGPVRRQPRRRGRRSATRSSTTTSTTRGSSSRRSRPPSPTGSASAASSASDGAPRQTGAERT